MGCYNYITQSNPEVLAQFPEAYQMIIKVRPSWVSLSLVIAAVGGALGSALMLMRRAVARACLASILAGDDGGPAASAMGDWIRTWGGQYFHRYRYIVCCCSLPGLVYTPQSWAQFAALICCIKVKNHAVWRGF